MPLESYSLHIENPHFGELFVDESLSCLQHQMCTVCGELGNIYQGQSWAFPPNFVGRRIASRCCRKFAAKGGSSEETGEAKGPNTQDGCIDAACERDPVPVPQSHFQRGRPSSEAPKVFIKCTL
uniref:Uncharacterized protein n=1 Tax=Pseudictyota dubia TaxID=2749911 RepID=A0A7R9WIL0_9STRA|mmetsp:Transcript_6781/g.12117  ORF Transcript_6781/g.12117 Transcript_6781/m.12117 type:complete len:124 (+) Transcript_6781:363-734(+)